MKAKELYEAASLEVIAFDAKDIIVTSDYSDEIELPPINVW